MAKLINVTNNIIDFLHQNKIYFNVNGEVKLNKNEMLLVPENGFVEENCAFLNGNNMCSMGGGSYSNSIIPYNNCTLDIGRFCSIASNITIMDFSHYIDTFTSSSLMYDNRFIIFKNYKNTTQDDFILKKHPTTNNQKYKNIIIGNDVYIGKNTILYPGITIGDGAVIAANSLVTKSVPPYEIWGGNPAKFIKKRFNDYIINMLLRLQWWDYNPFDIFGKDLNRPFIEILDNAITNINNYKKITYNKVEFAQLIALSEV